MRVRLFEYGTTDEIFYEPKHEYTKGLLRSIPRLDSKDHERLVPIEGTPRGHAQPAQGLSVRAALRRVHEGVPARDAAAHRFQRHALHAVLALPKGGV